ncbi:MAG: hypothetical protein HY865_22205 [Chloroflexi bacterium]|nr:hypothetical protein [Chloroflexota bacterium]
MSVTIDGTTFDIHVLSVHRTADFLDKYAERTEDGVLHRELIGVYFNYQLKFARTNNVSAYVALWQKLTEPVEFHEVTIPDEDGSFTFTAYFSNVSDELHRDKGATKFWKSLTVNFIAKEPARA